MNVTIAIQIDNDTIANILIDGDIELLEKNHHSTLLCVKNAKYFNVQEINYIVGFDVYAFLMYEFVFPKL